MQSFVELLEGRNFFNFDKMRRSLEAAPLAAAPSIASTRAERLRRLAFLQRSFDALPIDDEVAARYGQLAAAIAGAGRQPRSRPMDLLIAATALAHDARLYTRNAADLVGIEHLVEIVSV